MNTTEAALKRTVDLLGALFGLLLLALPFALIALLVKLCSRGPVLFRQDRIGRGGNVFKIVKFRTMHLGAEAGGSVTVREDRRTTPIGRVLRKTKLDELPQLWNILWGDMSFVGPRPDVPGYADRLEGEAREILAVRPGITGPASLFFRNEEELLARAEDAQKYNDEVLWPVKVRLNLEYVKKWSWTRDLAFLLVTVMPGLDRLFKVVPRDIELPDPCAS